MKKTNLNLDFVNVEFGVNLDVKSSVKIGKGGGGR
jgi:hypothetical protein